MPNNTPAAATDNPIYKRLAEIFPRSLNYYDMILKGDVTKGDILYRSQLELIASGEPESIQITHKIYADFIDKEFFNMQKLYVEAISQLDRIQTLPKRFETAKEALKRVQTEHQQLQQKLVDKMLSDEGFAKDMVWHLEKNIPSNKEEYPDFVKKFVNGWLDYGRNPYSYLVFSRNIEILGKFADAYESMVGKIRESLNNNSILYSHLNKEADSIGNHVSVPETEYILKSNEIISRIIEEMKRLLNKDPGALFKNDNQRQICNPLKYGDFEYEFSFAKEENPFVKAEDREMLKKIVRKYNDNLYLNNEAVTVLSQYAVPEARRRLESEVERIRVQGEARKQRVAAKIDMEIKCYKLEYLRRKNPTLEYVIRRHEEVGRDIEKSAKKIQYFQSSLTHLLGKKVSISRTERHARYYKIESNEINSIGQGIKDMEKRIGGLKLNIERYDRDMRNWRGKWFVITEKQRGKKINELKRTKEQAESEVSNANEKIKVYKKTLEYLDELGRLLGRDDVGSQFTESTMSLGELLEQALKIINDNYTSQRSHLADFPPELRNLFKEYQALEAQLKAAGLR